MIIEHKNGKTTVTNNDIAHKLDDANYYLAVAMASGNRRRKKYWLKKIKELNARKGGTTMIDLAKEIEKYYYDNFAFISSAHTPTKDIVSDIATHFYELGQRKAKEESK